MKKYQFFKIEGDKINRIRRHCPKCGPSVFIAEHKDRFSCGKCGYTEFKSSVKNEIKPEKTQDLPVKQNQEKQKVDKMVEKSEIAVQNDKKE